MLSSMEPLARPKERKVAMAKRRCLLQTWPLLKNRPAETGRNSQTGSGVVRALKGAVLRPQLLHQSFPSKSWSPSGCTAGPQSCPPASRWPPSPSSIPTQTLFCVSPDECRKRSRKHQPAADAGAANKSAVVEHVTVKGRLEYFSASAATFWVFIFNYTQNKLELNFI